jgi:hypothetical protein
VSCSKGVESGEDLLPAVDLKGSGRGVLLFLVERHMTRPIVTREEGVHGEGEKNETSRGSAHVEGDAAARRLYLGQCR